jgi:hypothetical protein
MFEAIEHCVEDVLDVCVNGQGFRLPITVVCVSKDGCVFAVRFNGNAQSIQTVPLHFHPSGAVLTFPINVMVSDSAGSRPSQFVIREGNGKPEQVH